MVKKKLSLKQYNLIYQLYEEAGKLITPDVEHWMSNLPAVEASKLIDTWLNKKWRR